MHGNPWIFLHNIKEFVQLYYYVAGYTHAGIMFPPEMRVQLTTKTKHR